MSRDILLTDGLDLLIENGDLQLGDPTKQELAALVLSCPGNFKNAPLLGVDVQQYLQSSDLTGLKFQLNRQLRADGKTASVNIASDGSISFSKA